MPKQECFKLKSPTILCRLGNSEYRGKVSQQRKALGHSSVDSIISQCPQA